MGKANNSRKRPTPKRRTYRTWTKDGKEHNWVRQEPVTQAEIDEERSGIAEAERSHEVTRQRHRVANLIGYSPQPQSLGFPDFRTMAKRVATPRHGEPALLSEDQKDLLYDGENIVGDLHTCFDMLDDVIDAGDANNEGRDIYLMKNVALHVAELRRWYYQMFRAMVSGTVFAERVTVYARTVEITRERDAIANANPEAPPATEDPDAAITAAWRLACQEALILLLPTSDISAAARQLVEHRLKVQGAIINGTPAKTPAGEIIKLRHAILMTARAPSLRSAMIYGNRIDNAPLFEGEAVHDQVAQLNALLDGAGALAAAADKLADEQVTS